MAHSRTLTVELGERSYPIMIGGGLLDAGFDLSPFLPGKDCLVVSNDTIAPLYLEKLRACLGDSAVDVIEIPDGESYKTVATTEEIIDRLVTARARERHSRCSTGWWRCW